MKIASVALVLLAFAASAQAADDFIDACIRSAPSGGDMAEDLRLHVDQDPGRRPGGRRGGAASFQRR